MKNRIKNLLTALGAGALLASAPNGFAQIASASLSVRDVPVVDTVNYNCTSGLVQIRVAAPISSAVYSVVGTSPAISLPVPNPVGDFNLTGVRSATLQIAAMGCYTDTTVAFDCNGQPLPVTLLAFGASLYQNNKGLLEWAATDEADLERYDIEESNDGKAFQWLGSIPVLPGNNDPEVQYKYVDTSLWRGYNFYRLAMRHHDGTTTYSPLRTVFYDYRNTVNLAFYPNPTTGKITAAVEADVEDDFTLYIYDPASRLVMPPISQHLSKGPNRIPIDISAVADGVYLFVYKLPAHQVTGTMRVTKKEGG